MIKKLKIFGINILLFITAIILIIIFFGIGITTGLSAILFFRASTDYFLDLAYIIDVFGNVVCQHFFNIALIKKTSKFRFGNRRDTISRVLGLNEREDTLTWLGRVLANTLNFIDKDHCLKSI